MNTSSRFVVAIHILAVLAMKKGRAFNSEMLSQSVNTNPVVIRRIIGFLRGAGFVTSQTGPDGGSRLARNAESITLLEVYEAVEDADLFHLHYSRPNQNCPVGANIQGCLNSVLDEAKSAMLAVLRQKTLMDITQEILDKSGILSLLQDGFTIEQLQEKYTYRNGRLVERKDE